MKADPRTIVRKRITLGLSRRALAIKSGVDCGSLWRIEHGRHQPRPATLKKLADALGCDIFDLITEETNTD